MKHSIIQDRIAGCLFLLPLLAYSAGNTFFETASAGSVNPHLLRAGALLWVLNALTVVAIALVLYPMLYRYSPRTAMAYLTARVMEAVLLLVGMFCLLAANRLQQAGMNSGMVLEFAVSIHEVSYQVAMLILGLGSVSFCRVLYRSGLLPDSWAVWGLWGYLLLSAGAVVELCGWPFGLYFSLPGGLFELALGIRLLSRGWDRR